MAAGGQQADRPRSSYPCRWARSPSRYHNRSLRYTRHGRATRPGPRCPTCPYGERLSRPRRPQVKVGRQDNGTVFWHLVVTFDISLASRNQKLDRIGQTGIMVLRLSAWSPCRCQLCLGAPPCLAHLVEILMTRLPSVGEGKSRWTMWDDTEGPGLVVSKTGAVVNVRMT